ncbi:hypothetical protein TSUD_36780 [Trifolium subterraneum]|uniref:Uncharacterized protein n=1 Tax=Trifolium subterraneum TaxID=3900 RepID=A0A2Z6LI99_TRISU|nr:hypothetical protein TSUD_36780 [Trifolium subterraneum]
MHRSASWNRFSDDYFKHATSSSSTSSIDTGHRSSYSMIVDGNGNNLPTYDPIVELAKKEKARVKFSENAVHLIPLLGDNSFSINWISSTRNFRNLSFKSCGTQIDDKIFFKF